MADDDNVESALVSAPQNSIATPPTLMVDENLMRLARENPRDEHQVIKRAIEEMKAYPKYADELFYSIAYKDNRKKLITFVEGPSIRASEHLWSRWGNCTVAARVADDRGNKIMVQGLYLDHENGLRLFADMEVAKMGKAKGGGSYPLSANDLRLKVAATESKAKRNAFLSALPVWHKEAYVDMAFDLSMGVSKKSVSDRIIDAKVFFMSRFKLEERAVLELIERVYDSYPRIEEKQVLRYLLGLKNAIQDGNAELEFIFGDVKEQPAMPQPKKKEVPPHGEQGRINPDAPGDGQEPA